MGSIYTTSDGDRLDRIAKQAYGSEHYGNVEAILAANPGLADHPPLLESGVSIIMPDPPASSSQVAQTVNLWD